ncbi:hypothetical protein N7523_011161 [Penicillium sp. IBT 18751x]|nr:hypothetical protein N7523_011161 [Penicillium sp. IBT 18751x]
MTDLTQSRLVHSDGIFHGLPTYDDNLQGLSAIITGANGISGHHMMETLAKDPTRWSKVTCLSRRPPTGTHMPPNVDHLAVDFLQSPEEIASVLKAQHVKADYVFFFSYVQIDHQEGERPWSNAKKMCEVNGQLLRNFLEALELAQIKPKRFILQTGAKNYGSHIGPPKRPAEEWDPRVTLEPNFYYEQEDILWEYHRRTGVDWGVVMPAAILGAVPEAAMNMCFPLAIYASVCAHMNKPLEFPGDQVAFQNPMSQSTATLNAYHEEWVALSENTKNQKFNVCDSSAFTYETLWPKIAGWYGIPWKVPSEEGLTEVEWGSYPTPRGYGPRAKVRFQFSLVQWAKQKEVQQAWIELAAKHNLGYKEIRDIEQNFGFLDWALRQSEPFSMSMDKSRKRGWHGFVDSCEAFLNVFEGFVDLKMIPPVPKKEVVFL